MANVFTRIGDPCGLGEAARRLMSDVKIMRDCVMELARDPCSYLGLIPDVGQLVARYIPDMDAVVRKDPPAVPAWAAKMIARIQADGMAQLYEQNCYITQSLTCSGSYVVINCGMSLEVWGGGDDMLPYLACRHEFHVPFLTDINLLGADHMLIVRTPDCNRTQDVEKTCEIYHVASTVPICTWCIPAHSRESISEYVLGDSQPVVLRDAHGQCVPGLVWLPNYIMINLFTRCYVDLHSDGYTGGNQMCTPPYMRGLQHEWTVPARV